MKPEIRAGGKMPDFELIDHRNRPVRFSHFTKPTTYDMMMGFADGYPLIVVFYRGFYCPRDGAQFRQLVRFQEELSVNYCKLVGVSADEPKVAAAYRYGLGASFPLLSDFRRTAIDALGIRDEVEAEYPGCAIPTTFVLAPDLTIHKIYDGWWFVGRPTLEELRIDLRAVMSKRSNWQYEAYNREDLKTTIHIPAEYWEEERPPGADGAPVARGVVEWFSVNDGHGIIRSDDGRHIFIHFSGIPGEGYRTVAAGDLVEFEVVTAPTGQAAARNVRVLGQGKTWGEGSLTSAVVAGLNL
jgi:peroxiredoxin/cold shock CspA family protein